MLAFVVGLDKEFMTMETIIEFKKDEQFDKMYVKDCQFVHKDLKHLSAYVRKTLNCQFIKCDLMYANFIKNDVENCEFTNCNLALSSFQSASLDNVTFHNCDFDYSDLSYINFSKLKFIKCDFDNACIDETILKLLNEHKCFENCRNLNHIVFE